MNGKTKNVQNRRFIAIMLTAGSILLVPLIGMQFSTEVYWSLSDFILAGILLVGTGLCLELVMRKVKKTGHRILLCGIILFMLFLIWVELAVGLIGTPLAGS